MNPNPPPKEVSPLRVSSAFAGRIVITQSTNTMNRHVMKLILGLSTIMTYCAAVPTESSAQLFRGHHHCCGSAAVDTCCGNGYGGGYGGGYGYSYRFAAPNRYFAGQTYSSP